MILAVVIDDSGEDDDVVVNFFMYSNISTNKSETRFHAAKVIPFANR